MALAPLATVTDLATWGVDTSGLPSLTVNALLDAASEAVRAAAGSPISAQTSTVELTAPDSARLMLPGQPVVSVASVLLDDVPLTAGTDFVVRGGGLYRLAGCAPYRQSAPSWRVPGYAPGLVTVTYTYGLATVPADIVSLVVSLVAGGVAARSQAMDPHRSVAYERIDDYQVGYRQGDDEVVNPFDLPQRTRLMLAQRFGGGAYVTGTVQ